MQRAVDRGFWISWYDLPEESGDEHIADRRLIVYDQDTPLSLV